MKKTPYIIILILVAFATLIVYATQGTNPTAHNSVTVTKGPIVQSIRLTGNLIPEKEVEIKSRLSGIMESVYVHIGQKVKKGDPIAKIRLIADPQSVENATKNLRTAEIQLKTELDIFLRNKELFANGVIPQSDFEETERQYLIKKADFESAKHQLEIVRKGYKAGNKDISDLVPATLTGTILELPLKEGASVTERNNFNDGSTIAIMADLDHFIFETQVTETEVVKLKHGKKFNLTLNAIKNEIIQAEWSLIHPKGETVDGIVKFPVQARLMNIPNHIAIKPGFTASAIIELAKDSNAIVIEERYIKFRNDSTFIDILEHNEIKEQHIHLGISDGVKTSVEKGLKEGDKIIKP